MLLHVPLALVAARVAPTVATLEAVDEQTCLMHTGGSWYGEIAIYVAAIGVDFEILDPPELAQHIRAVARLFDRRHDDASRGRQTCMARRRPARRHSGPRQGVTTALGRSDPPSPGRRLHDPRFPGPCLFASVAGEFVGGGLSGVCGAAEEAGEQLEFGVAVFGADLVH